MAKDSDDITPKFSRDGVSIKLKWAIVVGAIFYVGSLSWQWKTQKDAFDNQVLAWHAAAELDRGSIHTEISAAREDIATFKRETAMRIDRLSDRIDAMLQQMAIKRVAVTP